MYDSMGLGYGNRHLKKEKKEVLGGLIMVKCLILISDYHQGSNDIW